MRDVSWWNRRRVRRGGAHCSSADRARSPGGDRSNRGCKGVNRRIFAMKLVRRCAVAVSVLALGCTAVAAQPAAPARPAPSEAAAAADAASAPVSFSARKVYEQARTQLVQIRTVLKGRGSQTSVGSGFFVSGRRPHRHQLPRGQPGRAEAGVPRPRLRDGRRPRGAAADPAARRAARPRAAEGGRRGGPQLRRTAVPPRGAAAVAGRAHLLARQPARRRLRGRRGHLQRRGPARLLPADLLRRRAERRDERRTGARPGRPRRRHQRRAPRRRRAGQLPGAGRAMRSSCWPSGRVGAAARRPPPTTC